MVEPLDTGTDELLAHIEEGVAVLTLNRPQVRNALSDTLSPALRTTIASLRNDARVRAVLVTGAGSAFCAGGDVKGMGARRSNPANAPSIEEVVADQTRRQMELTGALYALPQPTIAALPGPAAGAGFSIALACDLRIMAASAFVTTGFGNVGLSGDYGASFFLTHLVGTARARELFFSGERVSAESCERLGIANRVVPDERLMDEALAWARRLAAGPTVAYGLMKANLDRALHQDLPACLAGEAEAVVRSSQTEDHREAVRAFVEKRPPRFEGR
ncbi:MAG: enoyl-CoA hydratase/isomerase family protein [Deltaproteobacteria bacterium]|nr:enoyl-CoA hydratase/isomerase family protein [Deltaproteobacteria bacterium]MBW2393302.1 enoyl-CoA hydratase/isomerase family protein [Deltaproteobacteria bacterium]